MLLGSSIAEAGHALAWVNLAGRKFYGCRTAGTQGAYALAADAGPDPRANTYAYVLYHGNSLNVTALYAAFSTSYQLTLENRPDSISHIFKAATRWI